MEIPLRSAFSPLDVPPKDLPHLILLDVFNEGTDFRYRLVGTGVVSFVGHEFTGLSISKYQDMHEEPEMIDQYVVSARDRRPTLYSGSLKRFDKEHVLYERLALPLLGEGDAPEVTQILAAFEFRYASREFDGDQSTTGFDAR